MRESEEIGAALDAAEAQAKAEVAAEGFAPDPADSKAFRDALGRFATGVTVITARSTEGEPIGITVNSFASVSLDPPLVLWSAARSSLRHVHFAAAPAFAVHVLAAGQGGIPAHFGRTGPGFEGLPVRFNDKGVPLIEGTLARFECDTEVRHDGGDHTIIIGRVTRVTLADGAPLVFAQGRYGRFTPEG